MIEMQLLKEHTDQTKMKALILHKKVYLKSAFLYYTFHISCSVDNNHIWIVKKNIDKKKGLYKSAFSNPIPRLRVINVSITMEYQNRQRIWTRKKSILVHMYFQLVIKALEKLLGWI